MGTQRPKWQITLQRKNKVERLPSNFKISYKTTEISRWGTGIKQTNGTKQDPEIGPPICGQLIFGKNFKLIQQRKKIFSTNCT